MFLLPEITGHLVLIMAPTGSGKDLLVKHLQNVFPNVARTVSYTTRVQRPQEIDGVNYHFISREEFKTRIGRRDFIEWVEYGGNLYGTLRTDLIDRLSRGEIVLCEIELQGVLKLLHIFPYMYRTVIYIDAGGWETLKRRALARAPMTDEQLTLRHDRYLDEFAHKGLADAIVYNKDGELEKAKVQIETIMKNIIKDVT